jgi:hypothetical protein
MSSPVKTGEGNHANGSGPKWPADDKLLMVEGVLDY